MSLGLSVSPSLSITQVVDFQAVNNSEEALVEFKEILESHFSNHFLPKSPEELFKKLNSSVKLEDIFNTLLEKCRIADLNTYIEYFTKNFDYTLTPRQEVAFCIFNDFDPPYTEEKSQFRLSNEGLLALMAEKEVIQTEENLEYLRNLAIKWQHPGIYTPSPLPIASTDVRVNLLWIQENPFTGSESIFDNGTDNTNLKKFLTRITEISSQRENITVQLWFDSAQVTKEAFSKTIEMIQQFKKETEIDLKLRDVRTLEIPSNLMECFHPSMPIYFRVDLLKVLIPYSAMQDESHPHFCEVRDVDIKPNTLESVYNATTMKLLETIGYVFGQYRGNTLDFENSFMIFHVKNTRYQATYKTTLIDKLDRVVAFQKTLPKKRGDIDDSMMEGEKMYGLTIDFIRKDLPFPEKYPTVIVEAPLSSHSCPNVKGEADRREETARFTKEGPPLVINGHRKALDFSEWIPIVLPIPHL